MNKKIFIACDTSNISIAQKIIKYTNSIEKFPTEIIVTLIAIIIPIIPYKLPCLDVSGEERPLRAKMNNTPETK